jgi:hypothetical protein
MSGTVWTDAAWSRLRASAADHGCTPIVVTVRGPEAAGVLLGELATLADTDGAFLFRPAPIISLEWRAATKEVRLNIAERPSTGGRCGSKPRALTPRSGPAT